MYSVSQREMCIRDRAGNGVVGAVACSGLPPEMDHQLLVDAICQILGVDLEAEM